MLLREIKLLCNVSFYCQCFDSCIWYICSKYYSEIMEHPKETVAISFHYIVNYPCEH